MRRIAYLFLIFGLPAMAGVTPSRSVYLNGIDISSAKNQSLSQVNVRIDGQGNVYIDAPQYNVQKESTFLPIGRQPTNQRPGLEHRPPAPLPQSAGAQGSSPRMSANPDSETETETPNQGIASPRETGDTGEQTPKPRSQESPSSPSSPLIRKEGTRKAPDANNLDGLDSGEIPTNPG